MHIASSVCMWQADSPEEVFPASFLVSTSYFCIPVIKSKRFLVRVLGLYAFPFFMLLCTQIIFSNNFECFSVTWKYYQHFPPINWLVLNLLSSDSFLQQHYSKSLNQSRLLQGKGVCGACFWLCSFMQVYSRCREI